MGKRNRQRRADKRRRAARRSERSGEPPRLDDVVAVAAAAAESGDALAVGHVVDRLCAVASEPVGRAALSRALGRALLRAVDGAWRNGWQPSDLVHTVGRRLRVLHRRVCADAIALDARRYANDSGADPHWMAQVAAVTPDPRPSSEDHVLDGWIAALGGCRRAVEAAVETLGMVLYLPPQPRLCPPPSEWGRRVRPTASGADPKLADRVRALLAKAESTQFPEEAEALTAKAQELIAKHALDRAMLEGVRPTGDVIGRRVLIDDPYGRAKSLLVAVIARANRCKTVYHDLGFCTVFGSTSDLDAVELLHASLLTQATAAMVGAGRSDGAHARGRSFRQTFLVAFATRIGERLREAASRAFDDAHARHGDPLLPVVAARDRAVDEACEEAFPGTRPMTISTSSPAGWVAGTAAADLARLGPEGELATG